MQSYRNYIVYLKKCKKDRKDAVLVTTLTQDPKDVPMYLLIDDDYDQVGRISLPELQKAWQCDTPQQVLHKIDKNEKFQGCLVIEDDECPYFQQSILNANTREQSAYLSEDDQYIYYYTNHGKVYRVPCIKTDRRNKREYLDTEMCHGHICISIEDEDGTDGEYWDITALIKENFYQSGKID